jgi:hypothetical protein
LRRRPANHRLRHEGLALGRRAVGQRRGAAQLGKGGGMQGDGGNAAFFEG